MNAPARRLLWLLALALPATALLYLVVAREEPGVLDLWRLLTGTAPREFVLMRDAFDQRVARRRAVGGRPLAAPRPALLEESSTPTTGAR